MFVTAAFSFAGTELAGLAAAETVKDLRYTSNDRQILDKLFPEHVNRYFGE